MNRAERDSQKALRLLPAGQHRRVRANVRHPDLVGSGRRRLLLESIGRDPVFVLAVGRLGAKAPAFDPAEAMGAHQPGHPLRRAALAALAQRAGESRPAIGAAALLVDLPQVLSKLGILADAGARPRGTPAVIAAARDAQRRRTSRRSGIPAPATPSCACGVAGWFGKDTQGFF